MDSCGEMEGGQQNKMYSRNGVDGKCSERLRWNFCEGSTVSSMEGDVHPLMMHGVRGVWWCVSDDVVCICAVCERADD